MKNKTYQEWQDANLRYLMAALGTVREKLARCAEHRQRRPAAKSESPVIERALEAARTALPAPSALDTLCRAFDLSDFESNILLLCAGMELDEEFASLCAAAPGNGQLAYPTFRLAMTVFENADWAALAPVTALRYWYMIEPEKDPTLASGRVRIDERILHYLLGIDFLDRRLAGLVADMPETDALVPSQQEQASAMASVWLHRTDAALLPILLLSGPNNSEKNAVAVQACQQAGLTLCWLSARAIPESAAEIDAFARLWNRETTLSELALLLDCNDIDAGDRINIHRVDQLLERIQGPVVVSIQRFWQPTKRSTIRLEVQKPTPLEQYDLWLGALKEMKRRPKRLIKSLVSQFNLNAGAIRSICSETLLSGGPDPAAKPAKSIEPLTVQTPKNYKQPPSAGDHFADRLWNICRVKTRPHLGSLAQSIKPLATWSDLVLPDKQIDVLQEIAVHVRQRLKVYEHWGFAAKSERGLGISALFSGLSGTGKTMAAEVLANELQLDLYRIDLSQVVSKYIGETEKNLARVFDEAEAGGAILLFDEADALFGKRSEVKDSHDRYANIEISYLLQRMEAYRGLAVLTTNMKEAIDNAFLRRIRFMVHFPFPDAAIRADIWRRIFPAKKLTEGLDIDKLARLNIAGGNIRNISLHAAFLAADASAKIRMSHILQATRAEYAKMGKPLSDAEIKGWDS